jgi:hypothetical protein
VNGVRNVVLAKSDDALTGIDETFDLVHSAIVFQHIEPDRGRRLFARLLERVSEGGVGAIQVTYAKTRHAQTWGEAPPVSSLPTETATDIAPVTLRRGGILGMFSGAPPAGKQLPGAAEVAASPVDATSADPEMQMNAYNLNHLLFALQQSGIKRFFTEFTDHGGELGVFLFFQKPLA